MFKRIASPFRRAKPKNISFETRPPDYIEYVLILQHKIFKDKGVIAKIQRCLTNRYIKKVQDNIVGKLHVVSKFALGHPKCDCCYNEHRVSDFVKINSLLVKLPKENMFVPIKEWDNKYLQSKVSELIDILMYLGAHEIKYNVFKKNASTDSQEISTDISVYGITVGAGMELETGEMSTNSISGKIIFQHPSVDYEAIKDQTRFHYLSHNHDWQHMVNQRLASCISSYEIRTQISESIQINRSAKISLKKLNVSIEDMHSHSSNLIINMSAKFIDFDKNTNNTMSPKSSGESIEIAY